MIRFSEMSKPEHSAKELLMRFAAPAIALCLVAALTASGSYSSPPEQLDPHAQALLEQGRAALAAGDVEHATDAFEAALVVQPGSVPVLLELAAASRKVGLQGKALRYYRESLQIEPRNVMAISGEGEAMAEKGAIDKARKNLTRLESLCGRDCPQAQELAAAIAKGPAPKVLTAEAVKPEPVITAN
jgi:tetratricopeptide (TPR) repeat protein